MKTYINEAARKQAKYQEDLLRWETEMFEAGHPELIRGYVAPSKKATKKKGKRKAVKSKGTKKATKKEATKKKTRSKDDKLDKNPQWMREE